MAFFTRERGHPQRTRQKSWPQFDVWTGYLVAPWS